MKESSEQFLYDLLQTPSPSGHEMAIQRKWLHYVSPYADEVHTDTIGNAWGVINPKASFHVLLAGHCDEIGFLVKSIDSSGFVRVEKLGGISQAPALGMKVTFQGRQGPITGVTGVNAEHKGGSKKDFAFSDLYIDFGAKSKEEMEKYLSVGDAGVYDRTPEKLLNDRFSGRGLDNRTGAFITAEVLRRLQDKRPAVGVYGVSTVNEETNMGGAHFAGAGLRPDLAIALDVTFAYDYPGSNPNQETEVTLGGGPVLAKGAPIHPTANEGLEQAAKKAGLSVQYELTPRVTGTDADRLRLAGNGVPSVNVSLPLRYMHAPVETASMDDIENVIELLVEYICSLQENEDLRPVHP